MSYRKFQNVPGIEPLTNIQFGVFSPEEIERQSVLKVQTADSFEAGEAKKGGLSTPLSGVTEPNQVCGTCGQGMADCAGHPTHIELSDYAHSTTFVKYVKNFLECICLRCSKLRLDVENPSVQEWILSLKKKKRLSRVRLKSKTISVCNREYGGCGSPLPNIKIDIDKDTAVAEYKTGVNSAGETDASGKIVERLTAMDIYSYLKRIKDEDCIYLGLDPKITRPESMILKYIYVTPVCNRPRIKGDHSMYHEDGHTHIYTSIFKHNKKLDQHLNRPGMTPNPFEQPMSLYKLLLQNTINSLYNNDSASKAKAMNTNRILKSIPVVLKGKGGLIRGNLMGKRVDFSARDVITGDSNIPIHCVGVPLKIAVKLTIPVTVTEQNIDELQQLVLNSRDIHPGANYVIPGSMLSGKGASFDLRDLRYSNTKIQLRVGDIVERHIKDGDYVLFNRQPTLHKMSIMGHEVRIIKYGDTFRMNQAVCKAYNADFDGDEMNMHVPQSVPTSTEVQTIAGVDNNVINGAKTSPSMAMIQDVIVGSWLMTSDGTTVDAHDYNNLMVAIGKGDNLVSCKKPQKITGKDLYSSLISPTVNILKRNGDKLSFDITAGQLRRGEIGKGPSGNIVHQLWTCENHQASLDYMTNTQMLVNRWMMNKGFSVGLGDTQVNEELNTKIREHLVTYSQDVSYQVSIAEDRANQLDGISVRDLERDIHSIAGRQLGEMSALLKRETPKSNSFVQMGVLSESKGSAINLGQIIGTVGSQNVMGSMPRKNMNGRALSCFYQDDDSPFARGFVFQSYTRGLSGPEFFFHSMGGREGLIDTAMKTAEVGYLQRRMVKGLEDLVIQYDYTVANSKGEIYQPNYGGAGINPAYFENELLPIIGETDTQVKSKYLFSKAVKGYSKASEQKLYKFLIEGRNLMQKAYGNTIGFDQNVLIKRVKVPVSIFMLLLRYKQSKEKSLKPQYVLDELENLWNDPLVQLSIPSVDIGEDQRILFKLVLYTQLSPKRCIQDHKLSKTDFDSLIKEIKRRYWRARVQPGTAVGVLAAQSIGEPVTQLTLNTFHSAGIKSTEQLGVPRINELLNLNKKQKTPQLVLPLLPGANKVDLMSALKHVTLNDIVKVTEIHYKISAETVASDNIYGFSESMMQQSPWAMRLVFERQKMLEYNVTTMDVVAIMRNYIYATQNEHYKIKKREARDLLRGLLDLQILGGADYGEESVIYILFSAERDPIDYQWLIQKKNQILERVKLEGYKNIRDVLFDERSKMTFSSNGAPEVKKYEVLVTEGINIPEIRDLNGIDFDNMQCNNILQTYTYYGIEAARTCLIESINRVFADQGVFLNYAHFSLLVDYMVYQGILTAMTRHGINKLETDVLSRASFEDTIPVLVNAAVFGERDTLKSVSSSVMVGQVPKIGTGICRLKVDVDKIINQPFDENFDNSENYIPLEEDPIFKDLTEGNHEEEFHLP
jgi:DNA-directed RNA polymerase II subunit RPB1